MLARRLSALALLGAAAACTEQLETTATCPDLCPEQNIAVQGVELHPVVLDTSVAAFPLRGTESRLLVARVGDSVDTRAIFRFDDVPQKYVASAGGDSLDITQVIAPTLVVVLTRPRSRIPEPLTLEAYDVTLAGDDTGSTVLLPLFTPDRRLGTLTVAPAAAGDTATVDTLHVPLDSAAVLAKVTSGDRLRIGLRLSDTPSGWLQLAPTLAEVTFRVSTDTAVVTVVLTPLSEVPVDNAQLRADLSSFTVIAQSPLPPVGPVITVGGLPGRRALLRFALPPAILDSSTIVRASLVMTQRPMPALAATDSLVIRPLPVTTSGVVTDLRRLLLLAANPIDPQSGGEVLIVLPRNLAPHDSGQVEFNLANLVPLWSSRRPESLQPLLVFAAGDEGAAPLAVQFFSTEAAPELRPRLRVSYVRRINFDLP